jgi:peptidoglycan/LPS O-acetylase OafA/YrhL
MRQFDVFEEQGRLERRKEEKPRAIGLGVIALLAFFLGLGIGEATHVYALSVIGCLAGIFLAMIAIDNRDTKGTAVTTIVLAALYLIYTLSGQIQAMQ